MEWIGGENIRIHLHSEASVNVTATSVLGGLTVMTTHPNSKRQSSIAPLEDHDIYLTYCYIWWLIWLPSLKRMRTCFLFGRVSVTAISVLSGLVVIMIPSIARDQGLIPHWGTQFFRSCYLFNPLLQKNQNWLWNLPTFHMNVNLKVLSTNYSMIVKYKLFRAICRFWVRFCSVWTVILPG